MGEFGNPKKPRDRGYRRDQAERDRSRHNADDGSEEAIAALADSRHLAPLEDQFPQATSSMLYERAGGDPIMTRILANALAFSQARYGEKNMPQPRHFAESNVDFYCVGANASHHFYLGVAEGKIYLAADEFESPVSIRELSEAELATAYIGHL